MMPAYAITEFLFGGCLGSMLSGAQQCGMPEAAAVLQGSWCTGVLPNGELSQIS
jgi:hypothetical protein